MPLGAIVLTFILAATAIAQATKQDPPAPADDRAETRAFRIGRGKLLLERAMMRHATVRLRASQFTIEGDPPRTADAPIEHAVRFGRALEFREERAGVRDAPSGHRVLDALAKALDAVEESGVELKPTRMRIHHDAPRPAAKTRAGVLRFEFEIAGKRSGRDLTTVCDVFARACRDPKTPFDELEESAEKILSTAAPGSTRFELSVRLGADR
jgi:hypothetical protein